MIILLELLDYGCVKQVWSNGFAEEFIDAMVHIAFQYVDMNCLFVGCLRENTKSFNTLERNIDKYNGDFYGSKPQKLAPYDIGYDYQTYSSGMALHYEFSITREQYSSEKEGIGTTLEGIEYQDLEIG